MITGLDGTRVCACCGSPDIVWHPNGYRSPFRCARHADRNPCAIEGCTRTTAAPESGQLANNQHICGQHWQRFVPARSRARRAYHAHFRRAKRRGGWDDATAGKFWRFWRRLVNMARRRAEGGYLDEAAINRLMGWD